jgi:hypothetical protein
MMRHMRLYVVLHSTALRDVKAVGLKGDEIRTHALQQ